MSRPEVTVAGTLNIHNASGRIEHMTPVNQYHVLKKTEKPVTRGKHQQNNDNLHGKNRIKIQYDKDIVVQD